MIKFDHFAERGPLRKVRERLNDMHDQIRSLRIANGKGYKVKRTAIGQVLEIQAGGKTTEKSDLTIKRFQVVEVKPTYLECYETATDGLSFASATTVKVLRPYMTLLQAGSAEIGDWQVSESVGDTRHLTRTLTLEETSTALIYSWSQSIYPTYTYSATIGEGDWIFAAQGMKSFSATDDSTPAQMITWLDLNVDARAWTLTSTLKVAVCVDGVTKYLHVLGSGLGVNA